MLFTVPGAEDTVMNKTNTNLCPHGASFLVGEMAWAEDLKWERALSVEATVRMSVWLGQRGQTGRGAGSGWWESDGAGPCRL